MTAAPMTQVEYAAHRGVTKPAVTAWKKRGLVIMVEGDRGRMLVDVAKSDALVAALIDPMRGRPAKADAPVASVAVAVVPNEEPVRGLSKAREELIDEQLIGQRLKNARDAGELGVNAELLRRAGELGRMVRERIGSMHRSLAERLAAEREPRAVTALLEAETDMIMRDLADLVESGQLSDDDSEIDGSEGEAVEPVEVLEAA